MAMTIRDNSRFRITWDIGVVVLVLLSCTLVPFQYAFGITPGGMGDLFLYSIDAIFMVDIALNFRTSYRQSGMVITERRSISRHYLKTALPIDAIATIPFDLIVWAATGFSPEFAGLVLALRLLRMFRIVRFVTTLRRWEFFGMVNPAYFRIARLIIIFSLLIHWIACVWFLGARVNSFPADSWVARAGIVEDTTDTHYIRSLYWTITSMTTVGYGDITPSRREEYIISMAVMILGASMYAFLVGNIASLLSTANAAKSSFWNRMDVIDQHLRSRHVPRELNERVRGYFDYLWTRYRGVHQDEIFCDLPVSMRLEILHHLAKDVIENVPLYGYCSPPLKNELMLALRPYSVAPGSLIAREGEVGREIFFIARGKVEIKSSEATEPVVILESGTAFGQMSLVLKERRTASAKALGFCDLFVLSLNDFERIRSDYPEFRDVLKRVASDHTQNVSTMLMEGIIL